VDRIELRIQGYAFAVFKDVSLKKGHRTNVRVSMEDRPPVTAKADEHTTRSRAAPE
jgi:hypothetical protein